jgi:hypothetical protein
MLFQDSVNSTAVASKPTSSAIVVLTPKETARLLKVSASFLAKARMRGDGPPFIRIGRCIRYGEAPLLQWTKAQQRASTRE